MPGATKVSNLQSELLEARADFLNFGMGTEDKDVGVPFEFGQTGEIGGVLGVERGQCLAFGLAIVADKPAVGFVFEVPPLSALDLGSVDGGVGTWRASQQLQGGHGLRKRLSELRVGEVAPIIAKVSERTIARRRSLAFR